MNRNMIAATVISIIAIVLAARILMSTTASHDSHDDHHGHAHDEHEEAFARGPHGGRLLEQGFRFSYPEWSGAARELCDRWRREHGR